MGGTDIAEWRTIGMTTAPFGMLEKNSRGLVVTADGGTDDGVDLQVSGAGFAEELVERISVAVDERLMDFASIVGLSRTAREIGEDGIEATALHPVEAVADGGGLFFGSTTKRDDLIGVNVRGEERLANGIGGDEWDRQREYEANEKEKMK